MLNELVIYLLTAPTAFEAAKVKIFLSEGTEITLVFTYDFIGIYCQFVVYDSIEPCKLHFLM